MGGVEGRIAAVVVRAGVAGLKLLLLCVSDAILRLKGFFSSSDSLTTEAAAASCWYLKERGTNMARPGKYRPK